MRKNAESGKQAWNNLATWDSTRPSPDNAYNNLGLHTPCIMLYAHCGQWIMAMKNSPFVGSFYSNIFLDVSGYRKEGADPV